MVIGLGCGPLWVGVATAATAVKRRLGAVGVLATGRADALLTTYENARTVTAAGWGRHAQVAFRAPAGSCAIGVIARSLTSPAARRPDSRAGHPWPWNAPAGRRDREERTGGARVSSRPPCSARGSGCCGSAAGRFGVWERAVLPDRRAAPAGAAAGEAGRLPRGPDLAGRVKNRRIMRPCAALRRGREADRSPVSALWGRDDTLARTRAFSFSVAPPRRCIPGPRMGPPCCPDDRPQDSSASER